MYQIIPEQTIQDCAIEMQRENPDNNFVLILKQGEKFKEALLTPVYILDTETQEVIVTSFEKLDMKYN